MLISVLFLLLGFVILIGGAEFLVRGSASLARKFGVSSLVVGLTIVAFGTSAPELIVNLLSASKGSSDIAIGNVVGSNIANVFLILGISALINTIKVKENTAYKEIPFALLAAILVFVFGNDALFDKMNFNAITRTDGFALLALFFIFLYYVFGISKAKGESEKIKVYPVLPSVLFAIIGIAGLFYGGEMLVNNAVKIAETAGLSEALIGLTIVAVGTSLPELATSVIAAIHKHNDIAVGNIIGSNIFNVFWILGLTSTIMPLPFNPSTNFDVLVGIVSALFLFLFLFIGKKHVIQKWQGGLFVSFYLVYIVFLIFRG